MDVKLSRQEIMMLQQLLEGSVGEMGIRIRHTKGLESKDELKRRRAVLKRLLDKLTASSVLSEEAYGVIVSSMQ